MMVKIYNKYNNRRRYKNKNQMNPNHEYIYIKEYFKKLI